MTRVIILFDKARLRGRTLYGSIRETDLGDRIRAEFMMDNLESMSRWLLMYGTAVEVESPEELKFALVKLIEDLKEHHGVVNAVNGDR
jgi:predicted DNA-binding transcriptional regulator YafY